jgi:UDP-N-acetylglucosamine--N-acetylmuramyl-(pentapeptide) pyrophosphoryl-undecaprenol N-acetylglucosamine transferase
MEAEIIFRQKIAFQSIPAAGVHGVGLKNLPGNLRQLLRGYLEARRIIQGFRPDVLLFTGGYLAVPVAIAGRSVPNLVFLPDIEPGLAIRTILRLADTIAISVEESRDYLPAGKEIVVSGYPVRSDLLSWTRDKARQVLDLSPELPVLLVFGGSRGARSINRALAGILPELLDVAQVVHITGTLDWEETQSCCSQLAPEQAVNYHGFPFLHEEMGAALRAADLVVSRSGASILGEYPLLGLPAILVPYPHAWRYQRTNARYLVKAGAAEVIEDAELPTLLLPRVRALLGDAEQLKKMSLAMKGLARPHAARDIARALQALAGEIPGGFQG